MHPFPYRVGCEALGDDRLVAVGGRGAGARSEADRQAVERFDQRPGKSRRCGDAQGLVLLIEKRHAAVRFREDLLDTPAEGLQTFFELSTMGDLLQDPALREQDLGAEIVLVGARWLGGQ